MTKSEPPSPEEFKKREESLENLVSFAEGDFFPPDQKTIKRVVSAVSSHLIYVDTDNQLQWALMDADTTGTYDEVRSQIAILQGHSEALMGSSQRMHLNYSLGTALAAALMSNDAEARAQLKRAKEQLKDRVRLLYLAGSLSTFLVVLIFAVVFWLNRQSLESALTSSVFDFILVTCTGAVGALVSVMLGRKHLLVSSDRLPYVADGIFRILIGMASAFFAVLAMKLGLLMSNIADDLIGMIAVGGLAGTLEYFVPNVVKTSGLVSTVTPEGNEEK